MELGGIPIRVTIRVGVRMTLMDTGRVMFRGSERGSSVRVQNVGCNHSVGRVVGVVVI